MEQIKSQFPIFETNPNLVYLDNNAATTQKPVRVIEAIVDFYTHVNANVHRGLYPLSEAATEIYELSRRKVAGFINADQKQIVFTYGTTDGLNGLAQSLVKSKLIPESPTILVSELEHHANLLPWQEIPNVKLEFIGLTKDYTFDLSNMSVTPDIVAVSMVSNVTGTISNIKEIRNLFPNAILIVDAAQAVAHMPIDVKELDIDFLVFSAHKMYGPTGIGVLYGKKELLENLEPFRVGGGMIREVNKDKSTWAEVPEKFEAGTPPVAEAVGLAAAIDFITDIGWDEIKKHEQELSNYLFDQLQTIPGIKIYHPADINNHAGVFSFSVEDVHPHDLSQILGENQICVRAGHHCVQILHREIFEIPASSRASVGIYNSKEDVDKLISGIILALETLK